MLLIYMVVIQYLNCSPCLPNFDCYEDVLKFQNEIGLNCLPRGWICTEPYKYHICNNYNGIKVAYGH